MKRVKRIIAAVIYAIFSYCYALMPEFHIKGGFSVKWGVFNLETFIMMLFIGAYLTAFWIAINRLFRN